MLFNIRQTWADAWLSLWAESSDFLHFYCWSVTKSCPSLWDPMDCSTPGSPVLHYLQGLLKVTSIESVMLSNRLILCCPILLLPSVFPSIRVFSMSRFFTSGGQSIGASASASILPTNIQVWLPLGLTGLISLLSKRLSRVFSSTALQKNQPLVLSLLLYMTTGKNHIIDYMNLC